MNLFVVYNKHWFYWQASQKKGQSIRFGPYINTSTNGKAAVVNTLNLNSGKQLFKKKNMPSKNELIYELIIIPILFLQY